jgi:hypothetical protein
MHGDLAPARPRILAQIVLAVNALCIAPVAADHHAEPDQKDLPQERAPAPPLPPPGAIVRYDVRSTRRATCATCWKTTST